MIEKKFKYCFKGSPIDYFLGSQSKKKLIKLEKKECQRFGAGNSTEFEQTIEENHKFIFDQVSKLSGEEPHTIRYFAFPMFDGVVFELCAIAKISNDGSTFVFANNEEFLKFINTMSGTDFNIIELE